MIKRHDGRTKLIDVPLTTSTVFLDGQLVAYASNLATPYTAEMTAGVLCGVCREPIDSTNAKYSAGGSIKVEVPLDKNVEWECDSTGSTYGVGDEVDASDGVTIDRSSQDEAIAQIRKVVSSTKVIVVFKFSGSY